MLHKTIAWMALGLFLSWFLAIRQTLYIYPVKGDRKVWGIDPDSVGGALDYLEHIGTNPISFVAITRQQFRSHKYRGDIKAWITHQRA